MKKAYSQPTCEIIRLYSEDSVMTTASLTVDSDKRTNVILDNKMEGGWNASDWAEPAE